MMHRLGWLTALLAVVGISAWGWYAVLVLEHHTLTALSMAIAGTIAALPVVPIALANLFPRAYAAVNTPIDLVPPSPAGPQAAVSPSPRPPLPSGQVTPEPVIHRVEKLVERQVVVVRCKYCGEYTPADASACRHCGGQGL